MKPSIVGRIGTIVGIALILAASAVVLSCAALVHR